MSEHIKGIVFWKAQMVSGYDTKDDTVKTACVTVSKITPLYYFIEPSEVLFNCSTRLRKNSWGGMPIVYHTTEKEALYALLNTKTEKATKAQNDIDIIKLAIVKATEEEL